MRCDRVWIKARLATLAEAAPGLGVVEDGVIAATDGRIVYAGPAHGAPALDAAETIDCEGRWITPGLIDPHTHLIFGGDRAHEFELRLAGASYEEIARAGGGIVSSVKATRAASEDDLFASAMTRLAGLKATGVTTVEIKSGYGLDFETELKMLRVARRIGREGGVRVRTSYLGLHAVPPEYRDDRAAYVDLAIDEILPAAHAEGLVDAVDAFCEGIGFSPAQTRRVFAAAQALGLPVKLHAEQLSDSGGAALAAGFQALSCDHLEWLSEEGAAAMAAAGTVAVLLPGAFYFLRETRLPPLALLRQHGVPLAIATDCNPGSSPCTSLLLMLNMACTLFRMTPEEALAGVTRHAAHALGLSDRGVIAPGLRADLVLWDVRHPAELSYAIGANPHRQTIFGGTPL
jgi:imidazolonepropionase